MSQNHSNRANDTAIFDSPPTRSSLAHSAWPMIHGSPDGTKNCPLPGPTGGDVDIQGFEGGSPATVITVDDDLVYYQQQANLIDCFAIDDFSKPRKQVDLHASFPAVGGNIVDEKGRVYFQVWTISQPPADQPMQLFCLQASNGQLLGQCTPFPMALGQYSAHTLGAVPSADRVFAICNSSDDTGGVVALDSTTMDTVWHFPATTGLPGRHPLVGQALPAETPWRRSSRSRSMRCRLGRRGRPYAEPIYDLICRAGPACRDITNRYTAGDNISA